MVISDWDPFVTPGDLVRGEHVVCGLAATASTGDSRSVSSLLPREDGMLLSFSHPSPRAQDVWVIGKTCGQRIVTCHCVQQWYPPILPSYVARQKKNTTCRIFSVEQRPVPILCFRVGVDGSCLTNLVVPISDSSWMLSRALGFTSSC